MTLLRTFLIAGALSGSLLSGAAAAHPHGHRPPSGPMPREQERAWEATRDGHYMPLPQLERRVMPFMGGADYLGPEINGGTYRMKFIQNGRVIWVDVDPQTGRIIRRSRP